MNVTSQQAKTWKGTQRSLSDTKTQKGNVNWLLKYAKMQNQKFQPIAKPTKIMLSDPSIAKNHHYHRKNTKRSSNQGSIRNPNMTKNHKAESFLQFSGFVHHLSKSNSEPTRSCNSWLYLHHPTSESHQQNKKHLTRESSEIRHRTGKKIVQQNWRPKFDLFMYHGYEFL